MSGLLSVTVGRSDTEHVIEVEVRTCNVVGGHEDPTRRKGEGRRKSEGTTRMEARRDELK